MRSFILLSVLSFVLNEGIQGQESEQQLIVYLDEGTELNTLVSGRSRSHVNSIQATRKLNTNLNIYLVSFEQSADLHKIKTAWSMDPSVRSVQLNHRLNFRNEIPNDIRFGDQWNLDKISVCDVWNTTTGGLTYFGDTIVIAVMESGLDVDHEDLVNRLWVNRGEIPNNGIDDDQNGYIDDYRGVSAEFGGDRHQPDLENMHGTSVAGVLAATGNNGVGISGVNWQVKLLLYSVDVLSMANAIEAYAYFIEMRTRYNDSDGREGAFIVTSNSSFGEDGLFEEDAPIFCSLFEAMGQVGILNVGAAENDQANSDVFGDVPANCSSDHLIVVTATDEFDERGLAAIGPNTIDLAAPGVAVLTTGIDHTYFQATGTSYACPLVAAGIALMHSHPSSHFAQYVKSEPALSSLLLKQLIIDNVDNVSDQSLERTVSGGRFNLGSAYEALQAMFPEEPVSILQIETFPNPVISEATIVLPRPMLHPDVKIYDVRGSRIFQHVYKSLHQRLDINLRDFAAGTYFVQIDVEGSLLNGRFFKH